MASSQVAGDLWREFGDPAADGLTGKVDTTLKQHFLDFTQAQIEQQVGPDRIGDNLTRKSKPLQPGK